MGYSSGRDRTCCRLQLVDLTSGVGCDVSPAARDIFVTRDILDSTKFSSCIGAPWAREAGPPAAGDPMLGQVRPKAEQRARSARCPRRASR